MTEETLIALRNYDHLIRAHGTDEVMLLFNTDTLVYGHGRCADIDMLTRPGFTEATVCFDVLRADEVPLPGY